MADNWMNIDKDENMDTLRPMPGNSGNKAPQTGLDKAKSVLKETLSWAIVIVIAIALSLIITKYVIFKAIVPTSSMEKTIMTDDKLVGWRIFNKVQRGDIIIFLNPDKPDNYEGENKYLVKRVIGLPGETLEIVDGVLYINNKKLDEDYLAEEMLGSYGPYQIPDGCYFMMGDNRNHSADARLWENKYLSKDKMVAKVLFKYSPKFKWFSKIKYNL